MDMKLWFAFMVACWLIALSPGSGAILSISHGSVYGVRRTSATIAGLQKGMLVILLVAGLGVGSVLIASATAFTVLKVLGALYLMYLGIKQWRNTHGMLEGDVVQQAVAEGQGDWKKRFMTGMLTNVTNPKGIVFMVAVLPQFIDPHRPLALQLLILLATSVAVDLVVMHGYAALAASLSAGLRSVRARRAQNRVFGGVLMAMGAGLLMVDRATRAG